jgi:hypothetical protein
MRTGNFPRLASLVLLAGLNSALAEIIDRVAVSVGNQVITEDQINEEIRVTAFLNHEQVDLSSAEKKKAAERLIEQALMKRDMDFTHYPLPQMSDADESLKHLEGQYPRDGELQAALQNYRITEDDLRRHLWWQLTVLRFIDYRFRPGVQLPDADVKTYYEQEAAKLREQGGKEIPSLEDARGKIEQILTQQRIDQALDQWLGDTRTQVEIRYRSGAFQ